MMTRVKLTELLKEKGIWEDHFDPWIEELYRIEKQLRRCEKSLREEGLIIKGERGTKSNPSIDFSMRLIKEKRYFMQRLKLNPVDSELEGEPIDDDGFEDV